MIDLLILISRHGERERLFKHHTSHNERTDPPLTHNGLPTIARVGSDLRRLYLDPTTCGETCLRGGGALELSQVRAESSGYARTIGTAEVLLSSLMPSSTRGTPPLPLPIYSWRGAVDDPLLRGYANCPRLASGLEAWRQTISYRTKENATHALRRSLGGALDPSQLTSGSGIELDADGAVPLHEVWNAYDTLATKPFASASVSGSVPQRSDEETAMLASAAELSAWLEAHKFGETVGGARACGGALLGEIASRVERASSSSPSEASERLVYYSAHYPTMLCLLSSLGVSADSAHPEEDRWLGERLLGFSSVLAIELHANATPGAPSTLRMRYLDPELRATNGTDAPDAGWRTLRLPCPGGQCEVPAQLPKLTSNGALALPKTNRTAEWLAACGRYDDARAASAAAGALGGASGSALQSCLTLPTAIEYASLVLLVALWGALAWWFGRRTFAKQRRRGGNAVGQSNGSAVGSSISGRRARTSATSEGDSTPRRDASTEFTPNVIVTD